jgi:RNA polymerase sigma factor (sigma-70 family)
MLIPRATPIGGQPMAIEQNQAVARYLRAVFGEGTAAELSDRDLLQRFTSRSGEGSELAFSSLVARHGPMVLQVCRAALRDEHDAQDAFQAVFLVLVHKAGALWVRDSLGPWLHAVALRVAAGARAAAAARRAHESKHAEMAAHASRMEHGTAEELSAALHQEVSRLPEGYRKAVVLCDLEGLTHEEAARRLGWPIGTVKSRQARGRERLRRRLIRLGVAPVSGAMSATLCVEKATAAVPASLADATVRMAALVSNGDASAGVISATAAALTKGAMRAMFFARLRLASSTVLLLGAAAMTAGLAIYCRAAMQTPPSAKQREGASPRSQVAPPRSALDALRPADIPAEKRLADLPENTVAVLGDIRGRHAGEVHDVALSPDGKLLATASDQDTTVRLWDAETLQPAGALTGHRAFVNCVSISQDGRWLASGSANGDLLLWDMTVRPPKGPSNLATRGKDRKFNHSILAAAFSEDGKRLAVAGDAGGVELFEISGAGPASRGVLPGIDQEVRSLTFSPDGQILALAGLLDRSARLWVVTGAAPRETAILRRPADKRPQLIKRGAISVAFSRDGKTLAALEGDDGVWLWDLSGPEPRDRGQLSVPPHRVNLPRGIRVLLGAIHGLGERAKVVFSPDGDTLAAAQSGGWIKVWDVTGGLPTERAEFAAHGGTGTGTLAFSPDGETLYSGGGDHLVRNWDLTAAEPKEKSSPTRTLGGQNAVAFSPEGKKLAVGGDDESVWVADLFGPATLLSRLQSPRTELAAGPTRSLAFSPDGATLIVGGDRNSLTSAWDVSGIIPAIRFKLEPNVAAFAPVGAWSLAFSNDGKTLVRGGNSDHKVRLWDMRGHEPKERLVLDGDDRWPPVVALSPDDVHLAFSGPGHSVRLWVIAGLQPREQARLEGTGRPILSLAFSADGKALAAGSDAGTRLWSVSDEEPRSLHPVGNVSGFSTPPAITQSRGFSLAFTHDGKRLIAADQISDKNGRKPPRPAICVYDVTSGDRLHEWDISVPCRAIALAPDGRHVAAARRDGTTLILRLPGGLAGRE